MSNEVNLYFIFITAVRTLYYCEAKPSLVELSYSYNSKTPNHPNITRFDKAVVLNGPDKNGILILLHDIFSSEHSGTHVDAPYHFNEKGIGVDKIPYDELYRVPGVVIDVRSKIGGNMNYAITAADIEDHISKNGPLPDGGVVLFRTGWGEKAGNPSAFTGLDQSGKLNFPGIGEEAAEYLIRQDIVGVGIDTLSIDVGETDRFPTHIKILGDGMYAIENVANMGKLPTTGFTLTIMPMNIDSGTGAPARIVAEIEGEPYNASSSTSLNGSRLSCNIFVSLLIVISAKFSFIILAL